MMLKYNEQYCLGTHAVVDHGRDDRHVERLGGHLRAWDDLSCNDQTLEMCFFYSLNYGEDVVTRTNREDHGPWTSCMAGAGYKYAMVTTNRPQPLKNNGTAHASANDI